ncbi:TlpA family protein disulfide reductase [Daejeonia sp. YH14]|uniref:TlpA family protein disulfide reductase n=1 Tax=Daejeonia sp. YH14 TaxID=3439042 RepID=UPI003F493F0C
MKKFILGVIVFTTLISCNKKENVSATSETPSDSTSAVAKATDHDSIAMRGNLVEYSPEKVTELLQKGSTDTLYITNFFATWCQPCMIEIPHFQEKMKEMNGQPVKFTFVSLDDQSEWDTSVKNFAEEKGLSKNIVLLDGSKINTSFFTSNFKTWKGETIPFTFMKKGNRTQEINGSVSKEELDSKIASFR